MPGNNSEQFKSFLYLLSGVLFALVLLDKGISSKRIPEIEVQKPKGFKNIGKELLDKIDVPKTGNKKITDDEEEVRASNLEEEISEDSSVPLFDDPEISNVKNKETIYVYFLKFYGKGNKSHSRLARVSREAGSNSTENIKIILNELVKGPSSEEKEKGILNAIPAKLSFSKEPKLKDGILQLYLSEQFEFGAGPEILRDRLDQLTHSILQLPEIKGVSIFINNKKVSTLGGDGVPVPSIMVKNNRKVMYF